MCADEQLEEGDVVTFSYDKFWRRLLPTDPKIIQIRTDILWDEVVFNHQQEILQGMLNLRPEQQHLQL